jgi:uncharacterized protein YeaC (DUF1315 family)
MIISLLPPETRLMKAVKIGHFPHGRKADAAHSPANLLDT